VEGAIEATIVYLVGSIYFMKKNEYFSSYLMPCWLLTMFLSNGSNAADPTVLCLLEGNMALDHQASSVSFQKKLPSIANS
jgi:hypothetical protein